MGGARARFEVECPPLATAATPKSLCCENKARVESVSSCASDDDDDDDDFVGTCSRSHCSSKLNRGNMCNPLGTVTKSLFEKAMMILCDHINVI